MLVVAVLRLASVSNLRRVLTALAVVAMIMTAFALLAPALKPLGNLNLLIFFVLLVGAMVFAAVPIAFAFGLGFQNGLWSRPVEQFFPKQRRTLALVLIFGHFSSPSDLNKCFADREFRKFPKYSFPHIDLGIEFFGRFRNFDQQFRARQKKLMNEPPSGPTPQSRFDFSTPCPSSLQSFSKPLTTCRESAHVITNAIETALSLAQGLKNFAGDGHEAMIVNDVAASSLRLIADEMR